MERRQTEHPGNGSIGPRQLCAGATSFGAAGVDQAKRAVVAGLAHHVERAAAACVGLLRARVGAGRTLNQRSGAAVRQEQRRAAAATAQHGDGADCRDGAGPARKEGETAFHLKPRSRLVFRSRDCATRLLRCVARYERVSLRVDTVRRDLLVERGAAHADLRGRVDHAPTVGTQRIAQKALLERRHRVAP